MVTVLDSVRERTCASGRLGFGRWAMMEAVWSTPSFLLAWGFGFGDWE